MLRTRMGYLGFAIFMSFRLAASGREIVFKVVPRNAEASVTGTLSVSQAGDSSVRRELAQRLTSHMARAVETVP